VISVDDHVIEPPSVWVDRLPKKYLESGPRVVQFNERGDQAWLWEGRTYPLLVMGSSETRSFRSDGTGEDMYARRFEDLIAANYDASARVEAMDIDGVHAQLNFPSFPRFAGTQFLVGQDLDLTLLVVQAYNDWMLDEWCATARDRFIPLTIVPLWDPKLAAAEIERCASKGTKSIAFPENPAPLGLPSYWSNHWDPVFAAAQEANLPLSMHIGTSGSLPQTASEATDVVEISLCGLNSMMACSDLVFSGILERFPGTRIAFSEGGAGWVPYLLERMDYTWERTRFDVDRQLSPTELFRRHFWACFISDNTAIAQRDQIGVDKLMYETDFPHNDTNWPNSRKVLEQMLADVPDDVAVRIAETNARELYSFGL
jgi:predicted TIM-barrel fold metal-dependent hydrolase